MNDERKEPHLPGFGPSEKPDRIPTLSEVAEAAPVKVEKPTPASVSAEAIEILSNRVFEEITPRLREMITATITELLNRQPR
ncbi:MAG: hypothetical protein ACRETC_10610 [Gammaproteobacteria bacterium]